MLLLYIILNLCIAVSHQQQRPRIVSGPSHPVIGKKQENITFAWTFKLLPGRTWIESVEDVAFGFWKAPGYLKTKLMVIGKYGKVLTRQNYGNKVSCTFNRSVLRVAFTLHNLSAGDENDYGLHIELGLARNPLKDVVALRLEDPPKVVSSLERNISLRAGDELVLNCRATGLPRPQISWSRSGRVFRNHTLVVSRVNKKDSGLYLCKAYSPAGKDSMKIFVRVEDGNNPTQATDSASGATLSQDNSHAWILIVILTGSTLILASIALAVTFYRRRRRLRKDIPYSLQRDTEQLGVKL
ncbi:protein amalgam-like [Porites lutea]|uniref:protein amalgam-like n=1 Tax=Porites lutea TaxID=51062 RepID=UPI003CC6ADC0